MKKTESSSGLISRLLRKNLSKAQLGGFILSNFVGLAIVITGLQFYADVRSLWDKEDSFIRQDYIVVNKKVKASNTVGNRTSEFSKEEISDLESQPWVRKVGRFESMDYNVMAMLNSGGRGFSSYMFFESIPEEFIDVDSKSWKYLPGNREIPVIISKDYLALYNFGFASSAGLPQITEQMLRSVPLQLRLSSSDGSRSSMFQGRIVGFSNRLNTILVPQEFMDWSNANFGARELIPKGPSRLIIEVSKPGDVEIEKYLANHDLEQAGDKRNSRATYFLTLISGLVIAVGAVITVLSFFILMLSVALLMQKNREKIHLLILQGFELGKIARPYERITVWVSIGSFLLAIIAMLVFRNLYIKGLEGLDVEATGVLVSLGAGAILTAMILLFNILSIRRKIRAAFYN